MYKVRICISWMTEDVILLATYICVDTFISGVCKKPCTPKEACVVKRILIWQLVFFCFSCTFSLLSRSPVYWVHNVDSYEMYTLRIYISWMSENVILLRTYISVDTYSSGECKELCRLKGTCVIKCILIWRLVFFLMHVYCFESVAYLLRWQCGFIRNV